MMNQPPTSSNPLDLYDYYWRIQIEYPGMRKEVFPKAIRFIRPAPGMSFVRYSRLDPDAIDAQIEQQLADLKQLEGPFSWDVYDHDLPGTLLERLVAHGFTPEEEPETVLILDLQEDHAFLHQQAPVDVRPILEREQLAAVVQVEEQVLGGDFSWIKQRLGEHLEIPGFLNVYSAYIDNQPVSTGWIYFYPDNPFAGLFGGATDSRFRQRGIYTALVAARIQEAIHRGYRFVTTGASSMSRPILEKLGFRPLTRCTTYHFVRE